MARLTPEEREQILNDLKQIRQALKDSSVRRYVFNNVIRSYYLDNETKYKQFLREVERIAKSKSLRSAEKWVKEAIIKTLSNWYDVSPQTIVRYVKKVFTKRELDELNKTFAKMVKEDAKDYWEEIKRERKRKTLEM